MSYNVGALRLMALARTLGFERVRETTTHHVLLRHPDTGELAGFPLTLSETSRNYANYRASLLQAAGRSSRGHTGVVRERRNVARTASPAVQLAAIRAARLADAAEQRLIKRVGQRLRELSALDRLMREPES